MKAEGFACLEFGTRRLKRGRGLTETVPLIHRSKANWRFCGNVLAFCAFAVGCSMDAFGTSYVSLALRSLSINMHPCTLDAFGSTSIEGEDEFVRIVKISSTEFQKKSWC